MLSRPVPVSSGETMAPWTVTVEGDPNCRGVTTSVKLCCYLLLSECLAHDLGRPRGLVGLLTSRSALFLAGDNALLATSRTCSGYWNCIICLEQERTSRRPWGYLISICQIINECAIILNCSCSTSPCIQSLIADWVTGSFPFKVYDSSNYLKPLLTQKC